MLNYVKNLKKISKKFNEYANLAKSVHYSDRLPNGNVRTKFDMGSGIITSYFPLEVLPAEAQRKYSRE